MYKFYGRYYPVGYEGCSVRNNFVQLSSNICTKISTQIVNWITICSNCYNILFKVYIVFLILYEGDE